MAGAGVGVVVALEAPNDDWPKADGFPKEDWPKLDWPNAGAPPKPDVPNPLEGFAGSAEDTVEEVDPLENADPLPNADPPDPKADVVVPEPKADVAPPNAPEPAPNAPKPVAGFMKAPNPPAGFASSVAFDGSAGGREPNILPTPRPVLGLVTSMLSLPPPNDNPVSPDPAVFSAAIASSPEAEEFETAIGDAVLCTEVEGANALVPNAEVVPDAP